MPISGRHDWRHSLMMAMKWSWGVVAVMLVGCSSGADGGTGAEVPTGTAKEDAGISQPDTGTGADGGVGEQDAAGEADGGTPGGSLTSEAGTAFTPIYTNIYALQYGNTIEVAFSNVPVTTQMGTMIVLVYQRAEAGPTYVLTAGELRGKTRCQGSGLPPAKSADLGAPLVFDASGRVSGGPILLDFIVGPNQTAEFHGLAVTPSTYACL